MKPLLLSLLFLTATFMATAQDHSEVTGVHIFQFTVAGIEYNAIIISHNTIKDLNDSIECTVRVRYIENGIDKMVQFHSRAFGERITEDGQNILAMCVAPYDNAVFIKGSGIYYPDNFICFLDKDGNYTSIKQIDENEMSKSEEDRVYTDCSYIGANTAEERWTQIQAFYQQSDPLYNALMKYCNLPEQ